MCNVYVSLLINDRFTVKYWCRDRRCKNIFTLQSAWNFTLPKVFRRGWERFSPESKTSETYHKQNKAFAFVELLPTSLFRCSTYSKNSSTCSNSSYAVGYLEGTGHKWFQMHRFRHAREKTSTRAPPPEPLSPTPLAINKWSLNFRIFRSGDSGRKFKGSSKKSFEYFDSWVVSLKKINFIRMLKKGAHW